MPQSILFNTVIALLGRSITLLLGLLATALMTRIVSVADFGTYSLVATIATFFQLAADFGLYLTASHELGRGDDSEVEFGHIVALRSALLIVAYAIGGLLCVLFPTLRPLAPLFAVFAIGLIAQSLSQLVMSVFQALGIVWRATMSDIAGRLVQLSVLLLLVFRIIQPGNGPISLAYAFAGGLIMSAILQALLLPNKAMLIPKFRVAAWSYLVTASLPIAILLVLNIIYFKIDTVMLAMMRSSQEVGWYSLAYKIIEHTLFISAMIGGLILPHMGAALHKKDLKTARGLIEQSIVLVLSIVVPIVSVFVAYSQSIILFVSTPAFTPSAPILTVLAWAAGIMFMGNILGFSLIALQKQKELVWLYGVLVVVNIGANIVCIPAYGALGAAWVTVVTEGIATAVASLLVFGGVRWALPLGKLGLILGMGVVAIGVSKVLPHDTPIVARIVCVAVVYGIIGYTMGVWNASATSFLRTAKQVQTRST